MSLDKAKAQLTEINATMYNLGEQKKQLEAYIQGHIDAATDHEQIEQALNEQIAQLKGDDDGAV